MPDPVQLKDHYLEARIFTHRLVVMLALIVGLSGILVARFYNLQVINHDAFVTQSDRNRVHVQSVPPTRGLIFDRNGVLLAENRPSYTLSVIKERVADVEDTLAKLGEIIEISDADREKFLDRLRYRRRPFEPIPLRYRLTEDEIARLAVNKYLFDGVEVEAQLVRYYPYGDLFAHTVGYVGRINDRELQGFSETENRRYSGTYSIGKIGLEKQYEAELLGEVGFQNVETNARGRVLRVLERTDPLPGQDLYLYLDSRLQASAREALGEYKGAVVAIEVATGGVLAMLSNPSYDPNLFVTGISYKDYASLNESRDLPLFNRTIQGQYPAASTVKPLLGLAALYNGVITPSFNVWDPGYFQLPKDDHLYRDWNHKRGGHGRTDLRKAIEQSCDVFFWEVSHKMGIDAMHDFGREFGLGQRTGIDIPSERPGNWPSRDWKRKNRGLPWFPGDTLNMSIGQGDVLVTPLQLAVMTAALAGRGNYHTPKLVKDKSAGSEYSVLDPFDPDAHLPDKAAPFVSALENMDVKPEHWDYVINAMVDVVHSNRGTAHSISRGLDYKIAGKTGTAQVVGIAQDAEYDSESLAERQRDHGLFVAFAPADNPRIAIAVIAENGEKSSTAAKVARQLFDEYFRLNQLDAARDARALAGVDHE